MNNSNDAWSGGDMRVLFEAWRKSLIARPNLIRDGEYYENYDTQIAWSAWQASSAVLSDAPQGDYFEGLEKGIKIGRTAPAAVPEGMVLVQKKDLDALVFPAKNIPMYKIAWKKCEALLDD